MACVRSTITGVALARAMDVEGFYYGILDA